MSAIKMEKVKSNLTCPVCNKLYNNPKYLPCCYHFYCEGCLEKMQVQSKIICPECGKEANVSAGGVKEFVTNFIINQLVDDLKVTEEKRVNCAECDEDDPAAPDRDCISFLSHASYESHKFQKACKEHGYELKHYCETCDQLVCLYCTMKEHNQHRHDLIENISMEEHRSRIEAVISPLKAMIEDLSAVHDNIDMMVKKIRKQGDEVNKQIDRHYDELVEKLMKQKDQVKQQVREAVSQKEDALTTQLGEVDSTQAELVSMKELKDGLEKSSDKEALSAKKQVIDGMQQLIEKFNKLSKNPVQLSTMKFIPSNFHFPKFGSFFDIHASEVANLPQSIIVGKKVEVTIITKDINGDHCFIGGDNVSVELKSFTDNLSVGEVRDNNDGSYMVSFVGEEIGEARLHVSINGQEIERSPYTVVVRNYQSLKLPDKIVNNNGHMDEPFGIAFNKNGVWAVTDRSKNCVYVFDGRDQFLSKFGSPGRNNGQFNGPRGITFDNDNHLYVVDRDNHRVQEFDVNGMYLLKFGGSGSRPGQLKDPYGITTHNGRVYVADYSNHRISVFQYNGQFCTCLSSDQLAYPYDVAVNINDQLLVAQYRHHCISMFSLDGQCVGKFGAHGPNQGQLNKPYSITTDVHGFILVTDCNHRVSVFDHVGNLIHCYGSRGSTNGQFISPHAIALSPSGSIYVSDTYNRRVQIFTHY